MAESFISPGIDPPSSTLLARLRELAGFLAAPSAGRLTEEQRALCLGIARRLIGDAAAWLDCDISVAALWDDWLVAGLPGGEPLALACFARAEEHRWREQSALRWQGGPKLSSADHSADGDGPVPGAAQSARDLAYLDLRIADRRRFDSRGNPCIAIADLDADLFRSLLLDIAAWRLMQADKDAALAARLGDAVRDAADRQAAAPGMDRAAAAYHQRLAEASLVSDHAAQAIERQDWPTLIALFAAASHRHYADAALALLTAEAAALPSLLSALRVDRAVLPPLEASLAMLPARATAALDGRGDLAAFSLRSSDPSSSDGAFEGDGA